MRFSATVLFATLLIASPASAQTDDVLFGLRGGVVELDCLDVEDAGCIDTDLGYSVGGFVDYGLASALWGGLYADVHGVGGDFDGTEAMLDLGATLKTSLGDRSRRAYFRPGIGVGYGTIDVTESANFVTTRATLELDIPQAGGMSWMAEAGVYFAPWGSMGDADVTFGPGFLLRGGVLF